MGFNQQNVDEAGCPPDDPNDIPYPPVFNHSTPTATVKSFLLKGLEHLVLLALPKPIITFSDDTPIISGYVSCPTPEHTGGTNCAGPMTERDPTWMKTASVTVILVMPHFIVSNGNGVVMEETVICLVTRY